MTDTAVESPVAADADATVYKIRGFVRDAQRRSPARGVLVSLWAEVDEGVEIPLGQLATDRAGYVSFDVTGVVPRPLAYIARSGEFGAPVRIPYGQVRPGRPAFIATCGAGPRPCPSDLPSIQGPDLTDLAVSPASFGANLGASAGSECGPVPPVQAATRDLSFARVVVTPDDLLDKRWPVAPAGMRLVGGQAPLPAAFGLPGARILSVRQRWWPIGSTLGDVVYSLPLAPGETVQLATVEWDRSDRLRREDDLVVYERLRHRITRDRTINEIVEATLNESQSGWSLMGGTADSSRGGASLNLQELVGIPIDVSAGVGRATGVAGSVAVSGGERDVDAESTQTLSDVVKQSASALRTLNSTVVIQADQAESSTLQTRAVSNNNRCHTLTIQYHEMLRTFRVETWRAGTGLAVLLPIEAIEFTPDLALRYQVFLRLILLAPELRAAFDALARYHLSPELYEEDAPPEEPGPAYASGRSTFTVPVTNVVDTGLLVESGSTVSVVATGNAKFGIDLGSGYTADGVTDDPADAGYPAPGLAKLSLVCRVGNAWHQGGVSRTFTAGDTGPLILQANDYDLGNNNGQWQVTVSVRRPEQEEDDDVPALPTAEPTLSKARDGAAMKLLLVHLNGNRSFYSRGLWFLLDPGERRALLESYLGQNADLLARLGDTPVASLGMWLAFPIVAGEGDLVPEPDGDYRRIDLVSIPSRGVFAESQLGSCNACEKRDVTRVMDWPLTQPAPITGISPGPRGRQPTVPVPAAFPAPVVSIQQAPQAPDPVGLAAALGLLGRPDLFRDMSGLRQVSALLDDLVNGAVSGADAAMRAASAQSALRSAGAAGGGGATNRSAPSEPSPQRQVEALQAIQYAQEQGLLDEQRSADAAVGVLGGEPLPTSGVVPASANLSDAWEWSPLIRFRVPAAIQDALRARDMRVQLYSEAIGPELNLDYFPVHIIKLPSVGGKELTPAELLRTIRLGMAGQTPIFVNPAYSTFEPYAAQDAAKWTSANPAGTVVYIDIPGDNAAVVLSAVNEQRWIFTTVYADEPRQPRPPGQHPVTGNREWGIRQLESGGWVFYTRGADRTSGFFESNASEFAYDQGDKLWFSLQERVAAWVTANGGAAVVRPKGGGRFRWSMVRALLRLPTEI